MKKGRRFYILFVVVLAAAMMLSGCINSSGTKATGGGWIPGIEGGKATFGFSGMLTSDTMLQDMENVYETKGQVQFVDHSTGQKFHVVLYGTYVAGDAPCTAYFTGVTKENYDVGVMVIDDDADGVIEDGDMIYIGIYDELGNLIYENGGALHGGNIRVR